MIKMNCHVNLPYLYHSEFTYSGIPIDFHVLGISDYFTFDDNLIRLELLGYHTLKGGDELCYETWTVRWEIPSNSAFEIVVNKIKELFPEIFLI